MKASGLGKETDIAGKLKEKGSELKKGGQEQLEKLRNAPEELLSTISGKQEQQKIKKGYASLCVLSYNRPEFLSTTLSSLTRKPSYPYELIIHDDGSDEMPLNVSSELRHARINYGATVIENPPGHNQGQGVALNRMFNIATGDFIIKLDADLTFMPGWLSAVNRLLDEHKEIGLLGLLHYYHDPVDSRKTVINRYDEYSTHSHILGSAFAVRRECWEELGPFEEHSEAFAEDYSFQRTVATSSNWVCALPKEDLVKNHGMGVETSTVVESEGKIKSIHKEPYINGM